MSSSRGGLDLAIVTSCHNYGRYLVDWARSIAEQRRYLPKRVAILDNGSTDATWPMVEAAREILEEAGIEVQTDRVPLVDFGSARNKAVELGGSDVEWVQHLDADDKLLPFALADFVELAPEADVVSFGYQRFGDLRAGPANRTRTYVKHAGVASLRSSAPASGVSPFRRSFWEREPYRTDMRGGWDTALWIGFAKLGARFVPTRRPVFLYRQHSGSIFNTRRVNDRATAFTGTRLANLRKPLAGVSVVVPYRSGDPDRDKALAFLRRWYEEHHPEYEVVVSEGAAAEEGGAWRKGRALDDALHVSTGWTIVVSDGDVLVDPETLRESVGLVEDGVPWVVPHDRVYRLDPATTARIYAEGPGDPSLDPYSLIRDPYRGFAGGGLLVVDRSNLQAAGGIPDDFSGWGAEDEALATILDSLVGPHLRLSANLWHLYHEPGQRTSDPRYPRNRALYRKILSISPDPDALFEALRAIREGRDPDDAISLAGGAGQLMVAVEGFTVGTRKIAKGETFRATDEEARRHAARPRKIARPVRPGDTLALRRHRKATTLDIRAEQEMRNEDARREKED